MLIAAFAVVLLVCPVTASGTAGRTFGKDATGSMVVRIQLRLRELGYLNFKPTGSYRSMTVEAVKAFQKNCREAGLSSQVDGVMGAESLELLFKQGALRASLSDVYIPSGPRHAADQYFVDVFSLRHCFILLCVFSVCESGLFIEKDGIENYSAK